MAELKSHEVSSSSPSSTPTSDDTAPGVIIASVAEVLSETTSKQVGLEYASTGEKRGPMKKNVKACRVPGCSSSDLSNASRYCLRHRICEEHFKSLCVPINGKYHRFCQKCTRFHEMHEFDDMKHSCRASLLLRKHRLKSKKQETEQQLLQQQHPYVMKQMDQRLPMNQGALFIPTNVAADRALGAQHPAVAGLTKAEPSPYDLALLYLISQFNQQNQQASAMPQTAPGGVRAAPAGDPVCSAAPPNISPGLDMQTLQGVAAVSSMLQHGSPAAAAIAASLQQATLMQPQSQAPTDDILQQAVRNIMQGLQRNAAATQAMPAETRTFST
eukprot:CAMPEP_0118929648 /NCGR_PEP_ID=MMETSP1169-20130426/6592_1 /TAXON_ID=36882 /ORGANISM="Pyramimonas obovata, Strain CCMP722" /LENGTH=328 /DNA_ID=CAMNT_0006871883 /DNA_START=36 /DNA_END=1022 /DNA_ORIENTATION=-